MERLTTEQRKGLNFEITEQEALQILETYNDWRRGTDIPQPDPVKIGEAIDVAIEQMKKAKDENTTKSTA